MVLVEGAEQGQQPRGEARRPWQCCRPFVGLTLSSVEVEASTAPPARPIIRRVITPTSRTDRSIANASATLSSQREITAEIAEVAARAGPNPQPLLDYPPYRSSRLRRPTKELHQVDPEQIELHAPVFGPQDVDPLEADLTIQRGGVPIGERMIVTGRITDGEGRAVRNQLVEVWQANAAGRYIHQRDQHPAPTDPNFIGAGRCLTDGDGAYQFTTIKPGPYPWKNHRNAWRPAHIHFSLFGTNFTQRLITQMYFPGDPLVGLDPIYQSITEQAVRDRLVASYDHDLTEPEWCTGYRWDIVLTGGGRTRTETEDDE